MNPGVSAVTLAYGLPSQVFDGVWVAQRLSQLTQETKPGVQVLPHQPLDGSTVDAVTFTRGATHATFYFDAQSYLLRGFDVVDASGRTWQARLSGDDAVALTVVPGAAFVLNAPASAHVIAPYPVPGADSRILMDEATFAAFASACHLSPSNVAIFHLKTALANGNSLLAACQRTAPSKDATTLVAALAMPNKAGLDDAVKAGQITPMQAAAGLAMLHEQLTTWVTTPGPHR